MGTNPLLWFVPVKTSSRTGYEYAVMTLNSHRPSETQTLNSGNRNDNMNSSTDHVVDALGIVKTVREQQQQLRRDNEPSSSEEGSRNVDYRI